MMSVIDNGGMGSIKKQIFLWLGLFFSCSNLGAMCPQTVGATVPGEGIWNVLTRVGAAANVIESQICALATVLNLEVARIGDLSCSFTFGQADIGGGNIYTISVPGTYCMSENVTFSFGTAITVNSSDVTIDLQGHTLNGANGALSVVGIRLNNFISNVIIQNGTIENISGGGSFYAIRDSGSAASIFNAALANIVIKDINFNNNWASIGLGVVPAEAVFLDGILIEDCKFFGTIAPDIQLLSISSIVRNCQLQNSFQILAPGVPAGTRYALVEDCVVSSTSSVQVGIISVQADNVVVRNCVLQGPANQGINVAGTNVTISDCILQGGDTSLATYGLNLTNNDVALVERCFVANNATGFYINNAGNSLKLVDCVAESNAFNGFYFDTPVSQIIVQGCSAETNGINGFVIQNNLTGQVISQLIFENCIAQGNSGDGFSLVNADAGSFISDVAFINCVSQRNVGGTDGVTTWSGDGFGIGSASTSAGPILDIVCQNCVAQSNFNDGFNFGADANKVDTVSCQNCTAEMNVLHGMNFSSTSTNCEVYECVLLKNGGNGINNLNANFGPLPSSANSFLTNRSFNNTGVDYFQINDGTNGQPFFSRSTEASVQGAAFWANMAS